MGQPGRVQNNILTPIDVVKADWLAKSANMAAANNNPLPIVPSSVSFTPPRRQKRLRSPPPNIPDSIVDKNGVKYIRGKFLGKGGFARVYEFRRASARRQIYACKIISKLQTNYNSQKSKINKEVKLHEQLNHPNVVAFHDYIEDDFNVYILIEFCPRKSLVQLLKKREFLTEQEARFYMKQIINGLTYIHQQEIIHRDLKLANLFVNNQLELKIGDFGLAIKKQKAQVLKNSVVGTPNYIAPEVINKECIDYKNDIWALGCILFTLLIGHPPFESRTIAETYKRIKAIDYEIPEFSISNSASNLIHQILQSDLSARPTLQQIQEHPFFFQELPAPLGPPLAPPPLANAPPPFPNLDESDGLLDEKSEDLSISNQFRDLQLSPKPKKPELPKISPKREFAPSSPKKDNCFPTNIRQKLTNVLCPDKARKSKHSFSSAALYNKLAEALHLMPEENASKPPPVSTNFIPFITKWIDYSNKYGFGFQLSDHSIGVLFNDSTKMSLSGNRTRVEFYDTCGKVSTFNHSNVPTHLQERFTLLKYFMQFMDENLTEGAELQGIDLVRKKMPYMKRWLRSSNTIIMLLSSGTLQINFFKDHTKIVISNEGTVLYIDEERHSTSYNLTDLIKYGCSNHVRSRLQYAASVLQDFAQLEGDDSS